MSEETYKDCEINNLLMCPFEDDKGSNTIMQWGWNQEIKHKKQKRKYCIVLQL